MPGSTAVRRTPTAVCRGSPILMSTHEVAHRKTTSRAWSTAATRDVGLSGIGLASPKRMQDAAGDAERPASACPGGSETPDADAVPEREPAHDVPVRRSCFPRHRTNCPNIIIATGGRMSTGKTPACRAEALHNITRVEEATRKAPAKSGGIRRGGPIQRYAGIGCKCVCGLIFPRASSVSGSS